MSESRRPEDDQGSSSGGQEPSGPTDPGTAGGGSPYAGDAPDTPSPDTTTDVPHGDGPTFVTGDTSSTGSSEGADAPSYESSAPAASGVTGAPGSSPSEGTAPYQTPPSYASPPPTYGQQGSSGQQTSYGQPASYGDQGSQWGQQGTQYGQQGGYAQQPPYPQPPPYPQGAYAPQQGYQPSYGQGPAQPGWQQQGQPTYWSQPESYEQGTSVLVILAGVWLLLMGLLTTLGGVGVLLAGPSLRAAFAGQPMFEGIFGVITVVGVIVLVIGILHLLSAMFIFAHRSWARWIGILLSALGTLFGALGLFSALNTRPTTVGGVTTDPTSAIIPFAVILVAYLLSLIFLVAGGRHFERVRVR